MIKSFNRQSIKTYFRPKRTYTVTQLVTMETVREEKLCGDLMELKIVSGNYINGAGMKKYILSSMVMRL